MYFQETAGLVWGRVVDWAAGNRDVLTNVRMQSKSSKKRIYTKGEELGTIVEMENSQ